MNENVNKVIYGNQTVMDITDTTAEESDVASGEVFYKANGARSVGTLNKDSAVWGNISGTLSDQTDLQTELNRAYSKTASETSSLDDLDLIPVLKISASSDGRRNVKFRNLKQILTNFFDTVYQTILTLPLSTANGGTGNANGYIRTGAKSGTTVGYYATAEGYNTTASGISSHSEGEESIASSAMAHAEGYNTTASGRWSHAEGYHAVASGDRSHTEGYNTTASGEGSHSEGYRTVASASYSHAEGEATEAGYSHQHVQGIYNDNKSTTLFEVGNGTANNARSNAFEVYNDGHINVNGDIYQNGKLYNDKATQGLLKSTVGWTGKNRLQIPASVVTNTVNGVTFTVNRNGDGEVTSIVVNGTATAEINFRLYRGEIAEGDYILSKQETGVVLYLYSYDKSSTICSIGTNETQKNVTIDSGDSAKADIVLYVSNGVTISNKTFYPMLRDASITDDTYEPYHESVEEEIEQIYADNGVLGAKNRCPRLNDSKTDHDVAFTVDDENIVMANGTATGGNAFLTSSPFMLKKGEWILSQGVITNDDQIRVQIIKNSDLTVIALIAENSKEVAFSLVADTEVKVSVRVGQNRTVNNVKFYPMLRLASDPDDTYVPYAMTNREITEELKVQAGSAITSDFTVIFSQLNKYGKVVELTAKLSGVTGTGFDTVIANIPIGYRCSGNDRRVVCLYSLNGIFTLGLLIKTNGDIQLMQTIHGADVLIHAIWLID